MQNCIIELLPVLLVRVAYLPLSTIALVIGVREMQEGILISLAFAVRLKPRCFGETKPSAFVSTPSARVTLTGTYKQVLDCYPYIIHYIWSFVKEKMHYFCLFSVISEIIFSLSTSRARK